jgi:signal peptidase II
MAELEKEEGGTRPGSGIVSRISHLVSRCTSRFTPCLSYAKLPDLAAQLVFWPLIAAGLTLDLWSKRALFDWLQQQQGNSISIIDGFLRLVIAENAGAAFGIATGQRYLLVVVSVIALIVIFAIFLFSGTKQKLVHIALGLFAAGVCGNLYDRIFNNGLVRDFIDVVYWPGRHWPAFNIADSMLCIGVGLMIISGFRIPKRSL